MENQKKGFGTAPVFFTAISTILGAILFLRFGFAVGVLGFVGTVFIIILGHLVTIPTALAISEIATNQKVEGGGEYYIISRSFGLNIGSTIGIALYLSQAISVAFYVIAFTEAFSPLFDIVNEMEFMKQGFLANIFPEGLPRQVVSVPAMLLLAALILKKGADLGVKALYVVVVILFISLALFFLGSPAEHAPTTGLFHNAFRNTDQFFIVFAIIFPAFTGMTAGVGLSGDLENPGKSIPLGSISATIAGMIIYIFIAAKLATSAAALDLESDQLIMSQIAIGGILIIPIGLAASTISSALGSILVAPRTLQALANDDFFGKSNFNSWVSKGQGEKQEPFNATLLTVGIAMFFVLLGDVNAVAKVISMFFMVTYGAINLISFLYHWGADPSYRPTFRSKWYISLIGFILCVVLMFQIDPAYAIAASILIVGIYVGVSYYHRDRGGMEAIFQGALFQLNRNLQVFLQKSDKSKDEEKWRPSAIFVTKESFERQVGLELMTWISHKYGFGTYIHLIEGYFSKTTNHEAHEALAKLIKLAERFDSNVYVDTIISPSYTSAIAQTIQLPSISGKENNLFVYEFDKENEEDLDEMINNYSLVRAGDYDICILASTSKLIDYDNGIHIWISPNDHGNTNLMILLSYIILGHPDWKKGFIKIFNVADQTHMEAEKQHMLDLVQTGRLPISEKNIEFIEHDDTVSTKGLINEKSKDAGLTVIGFHSEMIKHLGKDMFNGYNEVGNVLFINCVREKIIS